MKIETDLCEHIGSMDSARMLQKKPKWVGGNISHFDQPLLIGLTKILKPLKIVEIGVASGWSACLFIDALQSNGQPAQYIGIDYSENYYLDKTRKTGSAIDEVILETNIEIKLLLGSYSVELVEQIGSDVDLAFIDGDHMHPWAILDLLSLIPVLKPSAYVILHDLSLSTFERHKHTNRGPKYLYECWPFAKFHSSQKPTMIGAIKMPQIIETELLTLLDDTLHTPWEVKVDPEMLLNLADIIGKKFGAKWQEKFSSTFIEMNI